jgi:PleD family two-component response regulator
VLERLQEALRAELRSPGGPVTVSIGAAALHADERWNEWLARADAALYRAKNAGRDRFEIDRDPEAHTGSVEVLAERRSRLG